MAAGQVAHLVRVPHRDLEVRLRRVLEAHARLHGAADGAGLGRLHGRRVSRPRRLAEALVVVDAMRIGGSLAPHGTCAGGQRGAQRKLLFDRGCRRGKWWEAGIAGRRGGGAEGAQRIVLDSLESGGLGDETSGC